MAGYYSVECSRSKWEKVGPTAHPQKQPLPSYLGLEGVWVGHAVPNIS